MAEVNECAECGCTPELWKLFCECKVCGCATAHDGDSLR